MGGATLGAVRVCVCVLGEGLIRAGSLEEVMVQLQLRPEGEVPDLKEEMQQSQVPSHPA